MTESENPPERRTDTRSAVLCGAKIRSGERELTCQILNLSTGGAKVRVEGEIDPTRPVVLEADPLGTFPAEVVWKDGDRLGLMFVEETGAVERLIETTQDRPDQPRSQRRYARCSVIWHGELETVDGTRECTILNMSAGGAKIRMEVPPVQGTRVVLKTLRFGDFPGSVRWSGENAAGIQFDSAPEEIADRIAGALPRARIDLD